MIRISSELVLQLVNYSKYLFVRHGGLPQQDAFPEIRVIDFGGNLHDACVRSLMSAKGVLGRADLDAGVVEAEAEVVAGLVEGRL